MNRITHLRNRILRPEVQGADGNRIQQQGVCALPKDERRPMQDRESRDEADEEHVQTFVQEDRRNGGGLHCSCHTGRLVNS